MFHPAQLAQSVMNQARSACKSNSIRGKRTASVECRSTYSRACLRQLRKVVTTTRIFAGSILAKRNVMTTRAAYALKLPHSVKNAAQRLAAVDGVSLNQFIAVAVSEKIGAIESADVFLKLRAGKAKASDMKSVLRRAPRSAVVETDR